MLQSVQPAIKTRLSPIYLPWPGSRLHVRLFFLAGTLNRASKLKSPISVRCNIRVIANTRCAHNCPLLHLPPRRLLSLPLFTPFPPPHPPSLPLPPHVCAACVHTLDLAFAVSFSFSLSQRRPWTVNTWRDATPCSRRITLPLPFSPPGPLPLALEHPAPSFSRRHDLVSFAVLAIRVVSDSSTPPQSSSSSDCPADR